MRKSLYILLLIVLVSCSEKEIRENNEIKIVSWNVQNLFDGKDDGLEYPEYTSKEDWSDQLYQIRLKDIENVLNYQELKDFDVLVLNEVENEDVIKDILNFKSLKENKIKYFAYAGSEDACIKIAVLSKIPIENVLIHSIKDTRPILEVKFNTSNDLYLLAIHGKSKVDDSEENIKLRKALGDALSDIYSSILAENSDVTVLIAGDFNEDWTDENIMEYVDITKPIFSKTPIPVSNKIAFGTFYCFWLDDRIEKQSLGSYCYQNNWSCFDNILVSYGQNYTVKDANVVFHGILKKADGKPNAWIRNICFGVSDHLPVYLVLKENY